MELFDTRTTRIQPLPEREVRMYVCGVTPYDTTHLGHAFTFVHADVLARTLRRLDRRVVYVQNVTDIDDSILARARRDGVDWQRLGTDETGRYLADMRDLNVADPDHFVRATSVIPEIVDLTRRLVAGGFAYPAEGGMVYFAAASQPGYGQLSRLGRAAMLEIAAAQDDADVDDPRKRDPLDVALWKGWSGDADEPSWPSPWGRGRPGWHIECVVINLEFLGPHLTLHGGGSDLVFPHHETEIAIAEAATQIRPFARLWWHTEMVRMGGEKMSKSLGNMVFIRDLVPRFGGDAVRHALLSRRYRDVFEWDEAVIVRSADAVERLRRAVAARSTLVDEIAVAAFRVALADDLDTPRALEILEGTSGATAGDLAAALGFSFGSA